METTYEEFIASKQPRLQPCGFEVYDADLHPALKDFQRIAVRNALRMGRYALFEDCGLGKTFQQLEWARHVCQHTGGRVIILAPLAVVAQTIEQGEKWGVPVTRLSDDYGVNRRGVYITNYDQADKLNASDWDGVVLDESSILKAYSGKTKQLLIDTFSNTAYRLCCTATPSPNDHMELGNHAEFLGIMPSGEMLMRWFINDTMKQGSYRLKGHAEADFWQWVASWAMCVSKPSDVGCSDAGYVLPELRKHLHPLRVKAKVSLFADETVSATELNYVLRETMGDRMARAVELVEAADGPVIVWVRLNEESDEFLRQYPDAVEVRGDMKPEEKEAKLLGFARGEFRVLVTKTKVAQFGLNYQHCHTQVFASLDFSFEGLYQAIRRSYRFGQTKPVDVHILAPESMGNVIAAIDRKQQQFERMRDQMALAIAVQQGARTLSLDVERKVAAGENWTMHRGDCVDVLRELPENSLDFSVFSPPFANLYIYSDSVRDMGNCSDEQEFFEQFKYMAAELHRAMKPGRLVALHAKNLPRYRTSGDFTGMYDFRGDCLRAMEAAGFKFHCEFIIWTDPVIEQQKTKTQRLLYKQLRQDSTFSGAGMPEYLLILKKWEGFEEYRAAGLHQPVGHTTEEFPLELWRQWASPVWFDIERTDVLNCEIARENQDEKHICPLQLEVIKRAVGLYTNPGDTVFSPFAGIGSEGYQSVLMGRKFIGAELKEAYWHHACRNLRNAESATKQTSLF